MNIIRDLSGNVMLVFAEWEFLSDGTGRRCGKLRPSDQSAVIHTEGRFRWWTEGDRLIVNPLGGRSAWQRTYESVAESFREIAGRPQGRVNYPTWEYRFAVDENCIKVTPNRSRRTRIQQLSNLRRSTRARLQIPVQAL